MIKTKRIVRTGDAHKESESSVNQTDEVLHEISSLYLERCKAMSEGNALALQLLNRKIADLRAKLDQI